MPRVPTFIRKTWTSRYMAIFARKAPGIIFPLLASSRASLDESGGAASRTDLDPARTTLSCLTASHLLFCLWMIDRSKLGSGRCWGVAFIPFPSNIDPCSAQKKSPWVMTRGHALGLRESRSATEEAFSGSSPGQTMDRKSWSANPTVDLRAVPL